MNNFSTISDSISETYYALQFHFDVPKAKALKTLRDFLSSGEIDSLGIAADILKAPDLAKLNPGFVDRLVHAEYRKQCGEMFSFEKAARKLPGVSVL